MHSDRLSPEEDGFTLRPEMTRLDTADLRRLSSGVTVCQLSNTDACFSEGDNGDAGWLLDRDENNGELLVNALLVFHDRGCLRRTMLDIGNGSSCTAHTGACRSMIPVDDKSCGAVAARLKLFTTSRRLHVITPMVITKLTDESRCSSYHDVSCLGRGFARVVEPIIYMAFLR